MIRLNRRKVIGIVILIILTGGYVMIYDPVMNWFSEKDFKITDPVSNFITVLILSSFGAVMHIIKRKRPDYKHVAGLIQWFMLIMTPMVPAISAIADAKISLYWIYFPFVIASTMCISIGVYNAYPIKEKWTPSYRFAFIMMCIILITIGVGMHLFFGVPYTYQRERLFTWLDG